MNTMTVSGRLTAGAKSAHMQRFGIYPLKSPGVRKMATAVDYIVTLHAVAVPGGQEQECAENRRRSARREEEHAEESRRFRD
jgi:hypothetical protein